jgi:hypothetical protein
MILPHMYLFVSHIEKVPKADRQPKRSQINLNESNALGTEPVLHNNSLYLIYYYSVFSEAL